MNSMRSLRWSLRPWALCVCALALACADDGGGESGPGTESSGDPGDGDPGDGDPGDGDPGDGDPGDGDPGDGDPGDGDGDGDPGDGDGDGVCPEQFADCGELVAAFEAETLAIRSCDVDEDCGMELPGTSCGCTRNWVARAGADTTCFYELIEAAGPLQCELGLGSTCDCPEADGFVCVEGVCSWNYL